MNNTVDYVGDKALKASYGATSSVDNNLYFGAGGAITGNKPSEKITNSLTYQVTRTLADVGCTTFGVITTATGGTALAPVTGGSSIIGGGVAVAAGTATAGYGAAVTGRSFDSAVDNAGNLIERFTGGGGSGTSKMTSKQATEAAKNLGFEKTNYISNGQPVFKKGNRYITPDVDSHNGGIWKMADSIKDLGSRKSRMGTYDANLERIGD